MKKTFKISGFGFEVFLVDDKGKHAHDFTLRLGRDPPVQISNECSCYSPYLGKVSVSVLPGQNIPASNKGSLNQMRTKWFGGKSVSVYIYLKV